jgi:hypothetical protein
VKNSEGVVTSSLGLEEFTVHVSFNRDMDTSVQPFVAYGSDYPYGDFAVSGDWADSRTWVGTSKVTAVTGSGKQYFKVRGAVAADDSWLVTGNDYERFAFEIATSGAKSMSMQASGGDGCVELEWTQDDFETLAGYNVYRYGYQETMDMAVKLNTTIISADKPKYVDYTAEPGTQYYYFFKVVNTDSTESDPSGVAIAASQDTTPPVIEHSKVTSAPQGTSVSIVAYIQDNMSVRFATLYYRVAGTDEYSAVSMYSYEGTKYTATIPANKVVASGVEYYIEANDGRQSAMLGTAESPNRISTYQVYTITVQDVSGGRITLSKIRARAGEIVTVSAAPNSGFAYLAGSLSCTCSGQAVKIENGRLVMPEGDVEITATFLAESAFAYGDVNRDRCVDSADAILLLRYDAGLIELDQEQVLLADVNRDGTVTLLDAKQILRVDAGL